jgi:hypothetical protein
VLYYKAVYHAGIFKAKSWCERERKRERERERERKRERERERESKGGLTFSTNTKEANFVT